MLRMFGLEGMGIPWWGLILQKDPKGKCLSPRRARDHRKEDNGNGKIMIRYIKSARMLRKTNNDYYHAMCKHGSWQ